MSEHFGWQLVGDGMNGWINHMFPNTWGGEQIIQCKYNALMQKIRFTSLCGKYSGALNGEHLAQEYCPLCKEFLAQANLDAIKLTEECEDEDDVDHEDNSQQCELPIAENVKTFYGSEGAKAIMTQGCGLIISEDGEIDSPSIYLGQTEVEELWDWFNENLPNKEQKV